MKYQKVLIIDNFDSFTYNLVDYFKQLNCDVKVFRNNINPAALDEIDFDLLVLSPGPSVPKNAGNLFDIIKRFYQTKPIFGICLGLQALVEFFGGKLMFVPPQHGKEDKILTDQKTIYSGLSSVLNLARYHSLAAETVPDCFEISGKSQDGTVMSIRHKLLPIEAVQFHPESVLSMKDGAGMKIIKNVVDGKMASGNIYYKDLMSKLSQDELLNENDIGKFVDHIVEDQLTEDQKLILLVALSQKLTNASNLYPFINNLQSRNAYEINDEIGLKGIDICGTGGSGLPRVNTSTILALLLSHHGMPIIKHGNKAASGRFGSFDLLEALNVPVNASQEKIEEALEANNLAFLYARKTHPVVGKFAPIRSRMGVPSVFNVMGPLLNPYNPRRQFIGTSFKQYMDVICDVAIMMGKEQVVVARADDGLDDISISTSTQLRVFKNGKKESRTLVPSDFGIDPVPFDLLKCENKDQNIKIAEELLDGKLNSEHYKLIVANAAFIYAEFEKEMPLKSAYDMMVETIKSGVLRKQLNAYIATVKQEVKEEESVAATV